MKKISFLRLWLNGLNWIWRFVIPKVSLVSNVKFLFLCNNPKGIQLLTRLRLGLSQIRDHKFKHNTLNPICKCGEDIETSCHYLLRCSLYTNERLGPLNVIQGIDNRILELTDFHIVEVLLYGRKLLDISSNINILNATIDLF